MYFKSGDVITGSQSDFDFRDTFLEVLITNRSQVDMVINDIDVVNRTIEPRVELAAASDTSVKFVFDIQRTVKPTLVDIRSLNTSPATDIFFNGTVDNPIGTTNVVNEGGSILATNARGVDSGDGHFSLIRTDVLDLDTDDGDIGSGTTRLSVDLVRSPTRETQVFVVADTNGDGDVFLDLRGIDRDPGPPPFVVNIDSIVAGDDIDVLLRQSIDETQVAGTTGSVRVTINLGTPNPPNNEHFFQHFRSDLPPPPTLDVGVFGTGGAEVESTYDFRGLDGSSERKLPGLTAGGNIIVEAANPSPGATPVNVLAITEILGSGFPEGPLDGHHIDILTNGDITVTEITHDLRVGRIESIAGDTLLYSPRLIIDALDDSVPSGPGVTADVTGVNITMVAGTGLVHPPGTAANPGWVDADLPDGGIGTQANFLEINVNVLNAGNGPSLGVLRAFDITADSTDGIFLTEIVNDMKVAIVHTIGDVSLVTQPGSGSIVDANNGGLGDAAADVIGNSIDLNANGGSIGDPTVGPGDVHPSLSNDLDIDSQAYAAGDVGLRATNSIYVTETDSTPVPGANLPVGDPTFANPGFPDFHDSTAYGLNLVMAQTNTGDIRLTVREAAGNSLYEDLHLNYLGGVLFVEDMPEDVSAATDFEIDSGGWVELRIGDDLVDEQGAGLPASTLGNTVVQAAEWIDIFLDDVNLDPTFGAHTTFLGTYRPGTLVGSSPAHPNITRIFGHTDVDTLLFDETDLDGKTEVYGSQDTNATGNDGEDRFTVNELLTMNVALGHTLTLDGQADTDYYTIYTTGSQASVADRRNYVINLLDTGAEDDGVDEAFVYGVDSSPDGYTPDPFDDPLAKLPADDIFLLRKMQYIPSLQPGDAASSGPYAVAGVNMEAADSPAFVALLHGDLALHRDYDPDNAPTEVQRINYDAALNGRLNVYGLGGNDYFASDDNSATTQLDGGHGHDTFQIGQIFGSQRDDDPGPSLQPFNPLDAAAPQFGGDLAPHDVFPKMVATTRGWLSPGASAPMVVTGGTGNDEFYVYANQAEIRLEGDDDNDLFVVRAFALAAVVDTDANGDGLLNADDLDHPTIDTNLDGTINAADAHTTTDTNDDDRINLLDGPNHWQDDTIVLDLIEGKYVARPIIGLGFSTNRPLDIRAGGGEDEVQYNVNAPVSVDGGTGFDKLVVLATEFADDIAITDKGVFGAGLNVRYTTVEVVEVDGLEGDDEFFVQSTGFGVAYRVIGGLGSDVINVTGDVTADIVARELEGASGAVDHLVMSDGDPLYDGLPVDGLDYNVATSEQGLVVILETGSATTVTEGGAYTDPDLGGVRLALDRYTVHLSRPLVMGEVVYVTVSAARSPQEEADDAFANPPPLPNGEGDTLWVVGGNGGVVPSFSVSGPDETQALLDFRRHYDIDGVPHDEPSRAIVLRFDHNNYNQPQDVYLYAVDDPRSEGDRVVVMQHSVISNAADYDGVAVRNVEVSLRDNDTPGIYVTEVEPGTVTEDRRTLVIEGEEIDASLIPGDTNSPLTDYTGLRDDILVELAKAPQLGDVIVVELKLDSKSERAVFLTDDPDEDGFGDPLNRFQKLVEGDITRYFVTFDDNNWDDPVRVTIEAHDDDRREDPGTAVVSFVQHREDFSFAGVSFNPVDGLPTLLDDDYVFPNLRSGTGLTDIEVIDNEASGVVALESGVNTQLVVDDLSTGIDESVDDTYVMRLTRQPGDEVRVAVLTDGLADITRIGSVEFDPQNDDANPATMPYEVIGGYLATQAFAGTLDIDNQAGGAVLKRGEGSDLGSFIDEGFKEGQLVRIALTTDEGITYKVYDTGDNGITPLTIADISDDGTTLTLSDSLSEAAVDIASGEYELSSIARLTSQGEYTGRVDFTKVTIDSTDFYRMTRVDGSGWLGDGFLEGQRFRITQGTNAGDYKIAIIRGDNQTKDNTIELTLEKGFATVGAAGANQEVTVKRTAAVAHFTTANWYVQQEVFLHADPFYEVPLTREGVKVFPASTHLLSKLRGPLAVEGGPTGADRSLQNGLKLPGESDAPLIQIGPQPPESRQIDVLNLFNDSSQADLSGTMTETTLRGFGMADDLSFAGVFASGNPQTFGEPVVFPGGVSFGSVAFVDGKFSTDGARSSLEVVNFFGGYGNDELLVAGTLNPDVAVKGTGTFNIASFVDPATPGSDFIVKKPGLDWDWRAQGFLPGQEVTIYDYAGNQKGAVLGTFRVTAITDNEVLDTFDNTELRLTQLSGAPLATGNLLIRLEAMDLPVTETLNVVFVGTPDIEGSDINEGGGTITRTDGGDWRDDGFQKGALLLIDGVPGSWRIVDFDATGAVMTVRGRELTDELTGGSGVHTLSVAGLHGGLTAIHGGGNLPLELKPKINLASDYVERRDGLDWQDDGYTVGQFVTIEGLDGVLKITGFAQSDLADLNDDIVNHPFDGAGFNSQMLLSGPAIAPGTDIRLKVAVVDPLKVEADGLMSIATFQAGYSEITRAAGNWLADGFYVGQHVYVSGLAGPFTVSELNAGVMRLQNVALTPLANADLTVFGYDTRAEGVRAAGPVRMGGDTITVGHSDTLTVDIAAATPGNHLLTRATGAWDPTLYRAGQQIQIAGVDATFTVVGVSDVVDAADDRRVLELKRVVGAALAPAVGAMRSLFFAGIAGPDSPLVVYGDTTQDGAWYSGSPGDVKGYEFGDKPFDPFTHLPDGDNENDEWVLPLADPYDYAGNDVIDARALFGALTAAQLPSVGFVAYGGMGDDLIYGSQAGDHLAGGSGDDEIHGNRGVDHIYGDSGVNVDIFNRALTISTSDLSPKPTIDVDLINFLDDGTTITPYTPDVPVRDDLLFAGRDIIYGEGEGTVAGGPEWVYDDVIFGDHGAVIQNVADPNVPNPLLQKIQTTALGSILSIESRNYQRGSDDVIFGNLGRDIIVAGAGHDMADGDEADDLVFGDNVTSLTRMGGDDGNLFDDITSRRFQTLLGTLLYSRSDYTAGATADNSGALLVDGIARNYRDPDGAPWWAEYMVDYADLHTVDFDRGLAGVGSFGNDYIAGSQKHDLLFGQLGHDVVQGDGGIELAFVKPFDPTPLVSDTNLHVGASRTPDDPTDPVGPLSVMASFEAASTDGEDYIEGGGGNDVLFGGLRQDDIVGGSSDMFGLANAGLDLVADPELHQRPDGDDIIFGGAGTNIARNDIGDATLADAPGTNAPKDVITTTATGHADDADTIVGDNGNIVRIVGTGSVDGQGVPPGNLYLTFNYDNYGPAKIIVRGVSHLDYTPGGPDFRPDLFNTGYYLVNGLASVSDLGGRDEVHGEAGDDTMYLGAGHDIAFGDGQDDDIIGGWGNDWISGGTGQDGVIGDDGRIFTSRNTAGDISQFSEPLYAISFLVATDPLPNKPQVIHGNVISEFIYTPGQVQTATINVGGALKKTVDISPYNLKPNPDGDDPLFDANSSDDVIFGGLGDDFLHGASGDDAVAGGEALEESYIQLYGAPTPTGPSVIGLVRTDFTRPWNPGDILHFGADTNPWHSNNHVEGRLGEFFLYDEYDPRRTLLFEANGEVWKTGTDAGKKQYFLNQVSNEGVQVYGAIAFAPNGTPTVFAYKHTDGNDVMFGDLGNDWMVGGTGRDNMYAGWGNDLSNADDVLTINGSLNDTTDSHPVYEDRVYGGAGLDILIGNTGGDRLIDWVGEWNSYIVPFAPFGIAAVSRQVEPQLPEFLYALSASDGADPTRDTDDGTSSVRNGEPHGEIGLIVQQDHGLWQEQTGGPTDPQPGNIPGGSRDILRTADFNNGTMGTFAVDSGVFQVSQGTLSVAAASLGKDAAAVMYLDQYLPTYFEITATIKTDKPTGGWKSNAYVIFDYFSPTDFKFAGINVSTNKIEMGHRTATGWVVDVQSAAPVQIKPDVFYSVLVALNGTNVTVTVDNKAYFTHTFAPRVIDGVAYGLNKGFIGVGSDNAKGVFDNVSARLLPPQWTFQQVDAFGSAAGPMFTGAKTGIWTVSGGRYIGAPSAGTDLAVSLMNLGVNHLQAASALDVSFTLNTQTRSGFIFDRVGPKDFKFVAIDAVTKQVLIGHSTSRGGWVVDAVASKPINAGTDYTISVSMRNSSVSVSLNSAFALSWGFNSITVDGGFGLFAKGGSASFDNVSVKTNDPAVTPPPAALMAAGEPDARGAGVTVAESQIEPIFDEALRRWALTQDEALINAVRDTDIQVEDLTGDQIGLYENGVIYIDADAAGHGWFVDNTPPANQEFVRRNGEFVASAGSAAYGQMDLLTVVAHEIGHALGLDHANGDEPGVMEETLAPGVRRLPSAANADAWDSLESSGLAKASAANAGLVTPSVQSTDQSRVKALINDFGLAFPGSASDYSFGKSNSGFLRQRSSWESGDTGGLFAFGEDDQNEEAEGALVETAPSSGNSEWLPSIKRYLKALTSTRFDGGESKDEPAGRES